MAMSAILIFLPNPVSCIMKHSHPPYDVVEILRKTVYNLIVTQLNTVLRAGMFILTLISVLFNSNFTVFSVFVAMHKKGGMILNELYERIKKLCGARDIKISDLCKATGIRSGMMTDLKMGRSKSLSSASLSKIAGYFEISVDYLLGMETSDQIDEQKRELAELLEEIRRNPDLRTMFSLTKNATPEEVRQYIKVIKAIRGEE